MGTPMDLVVLDRVAMSLFPYAVMNDGDAKCFLPLDAQQKIVSDAQNRTRNDQLEMVNPLRRETCASGILIYHE